MEGINIGAILLCYLAALLFILVALVALVLALTGRRRAALFTISAGILATLLIAALATLSYLTRFSNDSENSRLWLTAATLAMAGAGQFIAAFRRAGVYVAALSCAAAGLIFLVVSPRLISADAMPKFGGGVESVSFPGSTVRLAGALVLTGASVLVAFPRPRGSTGIVLWGLFGSLMGAGAGQGLVETRCTFLTPQMPPVTRARVEVHVLDVPVSEVTGWVATPLDGPVTVRSLSREQAMWVYGPPVIGALVVGIVCAGVAFTLIPGGRGLPSPSSRARESLSSL